MGIIKVVLWSVLFMLDLDRLSVIVRDSGLGWMAN